MPYKTPEKIKNGWIIPKVGGDVHKYKLGNVIKFSTKAKATLAIRYIVAKEKFLKSRK